VETEYFPKRSMMPSPDNWEPKVLLLEGSRSVGIHLDSHQIGCFLIYLRELKEWNKKINLTSIRGDQVIVIKHFVDSLTPLKYIKSCSSLLDIGSGAGFPGIPLKIADPSLSITLVDSVRKKVSFQKHIIRQLKLKGIESFQQRLGDGTKSLIKERYFDVVISRAISHLDRYLILGGPYIKKGGELIAMMGKFKDSELKRHEKTISTLNLRHLQTIHLLLPFLNEERTLLFFKKAS